MYRAFARLSWGDSLNVAIAIAVKRAIATLMHQDDRSGRRLVIKNRKDVASYASDELRAQGVLAIPGIRALHGAYLTSLYLLACLPMVTMEAFGFSVRLGHVFALLGLSIVLVTFAMIDLA